MTPLRTLIVALLLPGAAHAATVADGAVIHHYGYGPGRVGFEASGWFADNERGHATEFEDRALYTRITTGLKNNFIRAYLFDPPAPGVSAPGRVVIRARRLGNSSKIIIQSGGRGVCTYLQKTGDKCVINGCKTPLEWGDPAVWNQWHDYVLAFDGKDWTFSIDDDSKTRVMLIARPTTHKDHVSLGMGYEYGKRHHFDVASIRFEPAGVAVAARPPGPPPDGPFIAKHKNGRPRVRCALLNGLEHGPFLRGHDNGRKAAEGEIVNGKRHGAWREWYPDGTWRVEAAYVDGKLDGVWRRWHPNGQLETEVHYAADRADGSFKRWFPDGKPQFVGVYAMDAMAGYWAKWQANGKKLWEHETVAGKHDKYLRVWYPSGQLKLFKEMREGVAHGRAVLYHPNGVEEETGTHVDGRKDGVWVFRDTDGKVLRRETYLTGKRQAP